MTVRVSVPDSIPVARAELVFTPFDIAAVRDSIAATASSPPPDYSALMTEMMAFAPSRSDLLDSLRAEWQSIRREIVELADSLGRENRESPGYAEAYGRLRTLHARVTEAERDLERRVNQLVPSEALDLARRATRSADSLRAWESVALAALPEQLDSLSSRFGTAIVVPLPQERVVEHHLSTGNWWLAMRAPHPRNPFLEYYWETSFRLNPMIPVVVPLGERHMRIRWRH